MATSYSHSLFYEILENVKEALLKVIQRVLSALNNCYLNNIRLIEKYREAVIGGLGKLKDPITHETYEYPDTMDYPKSIKATTAAEANIVRLHDRIRSGTMNARSVAAEINHLLQTFGREVIGDAPDPRNLKESVEKIVREQIRGNGGRMTTVTISADTLDEYLSQISNYGRDKEDIQRTKRNILEDYETLKNTYAKVTKDPYEFIRTKAMSVADPEREAFIAHEYARYSDIHVEMMRLFNGFITIYNSAFNTKLAELEAKIADRRNTITTIITAVGLFASLNTKTGSMDRKSIPYQPKFIT